MLLSELLEGSQFFTQKSRHYGEIHMATLVEETSARFDEYKTFRFRVSYYPLTQFGQPNGEPIRYTTLDLTVA